MSDVQYTQNRNTVSCEKSSAVEKMLKDLNGFIPVQKHKFLVLLLFEGSRFPTILISTPTQWVNLTMELLGKH